MYLIHHYNHNNLSNPPIYEYSYRRFESFRCILKIFRVGSDLNIYLYILPLSDVTEETEYTCKFLMSSEFLTDTGFKKKSNMNFLRTSVKSKGGLTASWCCTITDDLTKRKISNIPQILKFLISEVTFTFRPNSKNITLVHSSLNSSSMNLLISNKLFAIISTLEGENQVKNIELEAAMDNNDYINFFKMINNNDYKLENKAQVINIIRLAAKYEVKSVMRICEKILLEQFLALLGDCSAMFKEEEIIIFAWKYSLEELKYFFACFSRAEHVKYMKTNDMYQDLSDSSKLMLAEWIILKCHHKS